MTAARWMRSRATWLVIGAAVLAVASASIGAGCCRSGAPGAAGPHFSTGPGLCAALREAHPPALAPAPAVAPPESRLTVDVSITRERLGAELDRRVPRQLAQQSGRSIGAAGRVSYVVRRGDFDMQLDGTRLVVSAPIRVEAQVCKPLGPVCVRYGSCSPRLMARASVPLVLDEHYRVGASRVDVQVTRPCRIVGFDATGQIDRVARQQAAAVKKRIDRSLPPVHEGVAAVWERLRHPIDLASGGCLRVEPETVTQSQPTLTTDALGTRGAVTGTVRWTRQCPEPITDPAERPLPRLETAPTVEPGSVLRVALERSWSSVNDELARSLRRTGAAPQPDDRPRIERATARGAAVGGKPVIALEVQPAGTDCGTLWLVGQVRHDPAAKRLRLTGLEPAGQQLHASARSEAAALAAHLERRATLALPDELSGAAAELERAARDLSEHKPDALELSVKLAAPRIERVVAGPDGLVAIAALDATIGASAR